MDITYENIEELKSDFTSVLIQNKTYEEALKEYEAEIIKPKKPFWPPLDQMKIDWEKKRYHELMIGKNYGSYQAVEAINQAAKEWKNRPRIKAVFKKIQDCNHFDLYLKDTYIGYGEYFNHQNPFVWYNKYSLNVVKYKHPETENLVNTLLDTNYGI